MQGHRQIIAARKRREKPTFVLVVDYPLRLAEWELEHDAIPCVSVAGEFPGLADLRFLAGCGVSVSAVNSFDWADAILRAGASLVVEHDRATNEVRQWQV